MPTVEETSGTAGLESAIERLNDLTVVDGDVHQIDVLDKMAFAEYVEEPWRSRIQHQAKTDEPLTHSLGGALNLESNPTTDPDYKNYGLAEGISPTTPDGIHAFMDAFNTDYILLHGHELITICNVLETDYAAALSRGYNDYMLDEWLDENEGFKAGILVPTQDIETAVEEIYRVGDKEDMVAVYIVAPADKLLGHHKFHPIYEAAQDVGLPIDIHPGTNYPSYDETYGTERELGSTVEKVAAINQQMMSHVASIIFQGVPELYPDVHFLFLEHGISWLPWIQGRMDKNYERRKHTLEHLQQPPSEYLREYFFFGTQPMETAAGPANIRRIFDIIHAEDLLMYTTDFPHIDFDYPTMLTIPSLSDDEERKIFGQNAMETLGL